jgi:hypothetical protein
MIIARLRGGLGNQMFQYAAARALAEHHNVDLKLDLYTYTRHKYRKFELDHFNVPVSLASRAEVHYFTGSNVLNRYLNKLDNYQRCPEVFAQPHYHFYEDFFKLPSRLYLSGYWQSEKYFSSVERIIRENFTRKDPWDNQNKEVLHKMRETESVSIHLRLGDYASNSNYNSFFGTLGAEYYNKAIGEFSRGLTAPHFFLFSDNESRSRELFAHLPNANFITHNRGSNSYLDLLLMAGCKHNIIANSTFCWWGAWLNANPNKKVIAPLRWFNKEYSLMKTPVYPVRLYNTKDLLPKSWTRI